MKTYVVIGRESKYSKSSRAMQYIYKACFDDLEQAYKYGCSNLNSFQIIEATINDSTNDKILISKKCDYPPRWESTESAPDWLPIEEESK